ncbi:hypothetical protein [Microcella alkalica]|nr:hypothetical protein [Microcella alkalica]
MFIRRSSNTIIKVAATGSLALGALTLAGCATSGPEEGVDVEDVTEDQAVEEDARDSEASTEPYDGRYDAEFVGDYDGYLGETVTLSADVDEIVSANAFTIAGTDDTTVEALLVVHDGTMADIEEGLAVQVTGEVEEGFDVMTVEDDLGVELDDDAYADWEDDRFIRADSIENVTDTEE